MNRKIKKSDLIFYIMEYRTIFLHRWWILVGAVLIQFALGTLFCWGTLTMFISPYLGIVPEESILIFAMGLLAFGLMMGIAGIILQKYGPRRTTYLGGIFVGVAVLTSAYIHSLQMMIVSYGFLFGIGIAFGYVSPIAAIVRWFPDRKGFATGINMAGFGLSGFLFNYLIKALANPRNMEISNPLFQLEMIQTVPRMFLVLGFIYICLILIGGSFLSYPSQSESVILHQETEKQRNKFIKSANSKSISFQNLTPKQMLTTPTFWILWVMFFIAMVAGLILVGSYARFAQIMDDNGEFLFPIHIVDFVGLGAIAALFNGLGRIFWGQFIDHFSYRIGIQFNFFLQSFFLAIYFFSNQYIPLYIILTCGINFTFGGFFTIFPAAVNDLFGNKFFGPNYGIVFTSYGFAGVIGALMVQTLFFAFGSYFWIFFLLAVLNVIGFFCSTFLKSPKI